MLYSFKDKKPVIGENVFMAEGAKIIGDVEVGKDCSIWYNAVIRGDRAPIRIGDRTNVQDLCMIHVNPGSPITIGNDVTIGHSVTLHGCTIKDRVMIGMASTILNDSVISENSIVAAGSLVTERKKFPPGVMIMGSPARVVRELTEEEIASLPQVAQHYIEIAGEYKESKLISDSE